MLARWSTFSSRLAGAAVIVALILAANSVATAQNNGGNNNGLLFNQVVGGAVVNANGVLNGEMQRLDNNLREELARGLAKVDQDINRAGLRMVSVKGLGAALTAASQSGQPLPADVQFMAGLQRIEFIIVAPESQDIILVGPGEGWKANEQGNVVGIKSGQPVLKLEDFLVAMRTTDQARRDDGISVSIDPTESGVKQLQKTLDQIRNVGFNPALADEVQRSMGEHNIKLTGVPGDSRYAQILVAADYKMKRLSMGLEAAPISDFPSILEMAQKKDANNIGTMAPRFWMECSYEPIARSEDGRVWQLRGPGVKTMTQEQYFDRNGERHGAGKSNKFAEQWAQNMSERFDELSAAEPAFRELRNVMDMSVIAALIAKEGLMDQAGLSVPNIDGRNREIATPTWQTPKTVPTSCSFVHTSQSWIVTASGGVQVDSWAVAEKVEIASNLKTKAGLAENNTTRWWWNAN